VAENIAQETVVKRKDSKKKNPKGTELQPMEVLRDLVAQVQKMQAQFKVCCCVHCVCGELTVVLLN
jgi:hypothetical protein